MQAVPFLESFKHQHMLLQSFFYYLDGESGRLISNAHTLSHIHNSVSPHTTKLHASPVQWSRRQKLEVERRELPAWSARDKLLALVKAHKTLIVVGETGSGKTTQIPQFLMQGGFAKEGGGIACTQPRRVAAVTVAKRVAEEMGVTLGQQVR